MATKQPYRANQGSTSAYLNRRINFDFRFLQLRKTIIHHSRFYLHLLDLLASYWEPLVDQHLD